MTARRSNFASCATAAALLLLASAALAEDDAHTRNPTPFDGLGDNLVSSFTGVPLLLHAGAVVGTGTLVWSGGDHALRVFVQKNMPAPACGDAAYYTGYGVPLLGAPAFYVVTLFTDDRQLIGASSAVLQALALTVSSTVVLKVATGRSFPLHGGDPDAPDRLEHPEYARDFKPFGFHGRYAWPSGHTSSMTCIAASLTAYFDSWVVALIGYPIALATGVGMMVGDRHWASDVVAGALMGQAIGWSVGAGFRESVGASPEPEGTAARLRVIPLWGRVTGLAVLGEW